MSAVSVESGEFEEVDDETSEVDRELEEEEVEVVDEVNRSIVDENDNDWEGEFVDVWDCIWVEAGCVLTTSSDVEACVCEFSPTDWVVEDEGLRLVSGCWLRLVSRFVDGLGLGLGSDVWSEELTVEESEEGDVVVSCDESEE